ncbi:MAG TPA: hypothetical protein DCK95_02420 [Anaerolineaceae bacterium]|nr:hypothetical protein [Anaerolineaceae bacterium]
MKSWEKREYILTIVPALIGFLVSFWMDAKMVNIPVLVSRIDMATIILSIGILTSLIILFVQYRKHRQQQQFQDLIERENEEHRQFLQRLDHELKNPLSAITTKVAFINSMVEKNGNEADAQQVELSSDPAEEVQKMVFQIDVQTQRIRRLVSDLRKITELETCPLEFSSLDVHAILEELYANLKATPACLDRETEISLPTTPWRLPEIWADEDLIYLLLQNLIDNAIKFTRSGDVIEIRGHEIKDQVFIEIADSGIGIPEDEIDQIWNELYRAKNSRGIPGNGLGLSIVRIITKRMNGDCSIRSKDGQGTVVTLQFPVYKQHGP